MQQAEDKTTKAETYRPAKDLTYKEAATELDQIIATIQSDQCDIDKLSALTKRAAELITACQKRLTATEEELREILASLENK